MRSKIKWWSLEDCLIGAAFVIAYAALTVVFIYALLTYALVIKSMLATIGAHLVP